MRHVRRLWRDRQLRPIFVIAAAILALLVVQRLAVRVIQGPSNALRGAIQAQVEKGAYPADVANFYQLRDYQPLWLDAPGGARFWRKAAPRPEAREVAQIAAASGDRSAAQALAAAADGRPAALAKAELATSAALGRYVRGLNPRGPEPLAFIDPALARPTQTGDVLQQAASAPSLARYVSAVGEVNPVYRDLLAGLQAYRRTWSSLPQIQVPAGPTLRPGDRGPRVLRLRERLGMPAADGSFDQPLAQAVRRFQTAHTLPVSGEADGATIQALNAGARHYEALIEQNLRRAHDLPPVLTSRFLLVNVAGRQLWSYEGGKASHFMRVVVGTRDEPTPMMVGLMRYLVVNPYWNIPVDIVKRTVAPRVLKQGPHYLQSERLEVLSDWSAAPEPLDVRQVDWQGVANGWQELRVRQLPGGDNMMGAVKFMFPNPLGIYLHDTPNRGAFQDPQRLLSAGCVRLEQADALARWLLGAAPPDRAKLGPEQPIDLHDPVPVYITYLTAAPGPNGVVFFPDVYGKDRPQPAVAAAA